jgi:spermidine synthase
VTSRLLAPVLFCTGALALIYQVAWVRGLTLLLGSTTIAITTVVTCFMGGLALGAQLTERFSLKVDQPIRLFGFLELTIALCALVSPLGLTLNRFVLSYFFATTGDPLIPIDLLRTVVCVIFLLIPTCCMGAGLPILSHFISRTNTEPEATISRLYGINTVGACIGCLLTSFVLLPWLGLHLTLVVAGSCNLVLAFTLLNFSKHISTTPVAPRTPLLETTTSTHTILLFAGFLAGVVGLTCELVWTRILVLTVGGTIYAFATILATYLFAYGSGSYCASRIAGRVSVSGYTLAAMFSVLSAIGICLSLLSVNYIPDFYIRIFSESAASTSLGILFAQLVPAATLMFLPAFFFGWFFPCALAQHQNDPGGLPKVTARIYSWNTVGGIVGSAATAFFLIPYSGIDFSLRFAAVLSCVASLCLVTQLSGFARRSILAINIGCVLAVFLIVPAIDKAIVSAGSGAYASHYKTELVEENRTIKASVDASQDLLFYRDGFTATVTVTRDKLSENRDLYLSTNGKIDGSSHFDMPTQKLTAHLPLLFHTDPRTVCVIGFGTGTTVGSASLHPNTTVDALEIEAAVIEGSQFLNRFNNQPLSRSNVNLHVTDARLFLTLRRNTYDAILSEPSNPWLAGVSDLFTVEFYRIGKTALTEKGVFGQWVQMYNLDQESLRLLIRTFQSVFPETYLAMPLPGSDLLLIGTKGDYRPSVEEIRRRISNELIKNDLADSNVTIYSAEALLARLLLGPNDVKKYATGSNVNSDSLPILSYTAPFALYTQTRTENMKGILSLTQTPQTILGIKSDQATTQTLDDARVAFFEQYSIPTQ